MKTLSGNEKSNNQRYYINYVTISFVLLRYIERDEGSVLRQGNNCIHMPVLLKGTTTWATETCGRKRFLLIMPSSWIYFFFMIISLTSMYLKREEEAHYCDVVHLALKVLT